MKLILAIIFITTLLCCNNEKSYQQELSNIVSEYPNEDLSQFDAIVIIPGSGCSGCITDAEHYFQKNIGNDRIKFVFTFITSKKLLTLLIGEDNINSHNILIDNNNTFYLKKFIEKDYPYTIHFVDGQIVDVKPFDATDIY